MPQIENPIEIPEDSIEGKLLHLKESSNQTVENFEGLFRCSHFFDTRTNESQESGIGTGDTEELINIFDSILRTNSI